MGLKHGPEHPSLATEISGKETWSCQQDQHTWQGEVGGQGKGRSHQRGRSVRVLSHYREEDGDVIWFPT